MKFLNTKISIKSCSPSFIDKFKWSIHRISYEAWMYKHSTIICKKIFYAPNIFIFTIFIILLKYWAKIMKSTTNFCQFERFPTAKIIKDSRKTNRTVIASPFVDQLIANICMSYRFAIKCPVKNVVMTHIYFLSICNLIQWYIAKKKDKNDKRFESKANLKENI